MRRVTITRLANPQRVKLPGDRYYSTPLMTVVDEAGTPVAGVVTDIGILSGDMTACSVGSPIEVTLGFEDGRKEIVLATFIKEKH